MKNRIPSALLLLALMAAACSKGAPERPSDGKPPGVAPPPSTPLGRDGLPLNWVDAPFSQRSLYLEAEAPGPCPPCPPDARCAPCPPPFHRFSTHPAGHPDGKMVFVAFTRPPTGLKIGGYYHLSGRTVAWAPHGDIFVTMDHRAREWFPPEKCLALAAEYKEIRGSSKGTCEKDEDCTILPGGVDDCGRALDTKTAARLEPIHRMFRDMCGNTIQCEPRFAQPACREGRCVEIRGK